MATSTTRRPVLQGDVLQHSDPTVRDFARQVAAGLGQAVTLQDHRGGTTPVRINTAGSVSALEVYRSGEWTSIGASSVSRSGSSGRTVVYASGDDSGANIDHNALSNRQGGRDDGTLGLREDYHLTAAEYAGIWGHKLYAISAEMNVPLTAVRASGVTNASYNALWLEHQTSGDMVDGFGVYIGFVAHDSSATDCPLGRFGMVRAGADDTGDFVWSPAAAGVVAERMRLSSAGALTVYGNLAPDSNADHCLGSAAAYWQSIYGARLYLNSTAYLDGATAGVAVFTGDVRVSGIATGTTGTATLVLNLPGGSYSTGHPYINLTYGGSGSVWSLSQEASGDTDYLAAKGHSFYTNASVATPAVKMLTLGGVNVGTTTAAAAYGELAATSLFASALTVSGLTPTHVLFAGAGGLISGEADLTWTAGTDTLYAKLLSAQNNLTFTGTNVAIRPSTSDGSDNALLSLYAGGSAGHTRGAQIQFTGNEYGANYEGCLILYAGNPGTTGTYDGMIGLSTGANTIRWLVDRSGMLTPTADNTYDLGTSTAGVRELNLSDANTTAPSTEGAVRVNGGARALQHYVGGVLHTNGATLYAGPTALDSLDGSATQAEQPYATSYTIQSAYFHSAKGFRIRALVRVHTDGASSSAHTYRIRWGGTSGTAIAVSGDFAGGTSNRYGTVVLEAYVLCYSVGATATCPWIGKAQTSSNTAAGAWTTPTVRLYTPTDPPQLATNADQQIVVTQQVDGTSAGTWDTDLLILTVEAVN